MTEESDKEMAVHYRTQGFFIKKADRGEDNQLFTVYTKDFGKLNILGKAIRKIKSKLRGGAELFYLSELEFIQGKSHKTLTDTILINKFPDIRQEPEKFKIVSDISEVLDNLVTKEEKDKQIWNLLEETLEKLNSSKKTEIIYYYFFWNLAACLGYEPEFQDRLLDGKKIDCDVVKILKVILKKDWSILSRLKLEVSHLKLLKEVSSWYNEKIQA